MVVLPVNQTPYTSSYGPRYIPQAMGSVTEALSGVSDRIRILLVPQYTRVGKGLTIPRSFGVVLSWIEKEIAVKRK